MLSAAVPAVAQDEAVQLFHLADGSTIRHDRYDGVLRRIDNVGRQVALVNLPRAQVIEKRTEVVVSSHETRLLVVHNGSTNRYPPGHVVMILDAMSLKRVADFPLGDC
jgi:hypothetical protein